MNQTNISKLVGGLGSPGKMPCFSYNISARKCNIGSKLRDVKDSTCSKCYAFRGNYNWPTSVNAHERRFNLMMNDPNWVSNMIRVINDNTNGYFRWFDSGDIQSEKNLQDIVEVIKNTPTTKHWLPTREYSIISNYVKNGGTFPENVTVRLSAYMIEGNPPSVFAKKNGVLTSNVTKTEGFNCPASQQSNRCLACRKCWDKSVENITYKYH